MLASQRLEKIRKIFLEKEAVELSYLAQTLGVSEITIRRDFEKLEEEGFIKKQYGGATLSDHIKSAKRPPYHEGNLDDETILHISRIAGRIIESGDVVFIGGGECARALARGIDAQQTLTVLTNDIFVAAELWNHHRVKLTVTGGELLAGTGMLVGTRALNSLRAAHISKAFIDVRGVDIEKGFSVDAFEVCDIFTEVMSLARETIAMAEYSRFGTVACVRLAQIGDMERVVTNKEVSDTYKKTFFEMGTKLYTTYDFR